MAHLFMRAKPVQAGMTGPLSGTHFALNLGETGLKTGRFPGQIWQNGLNSA